MIALPIRPIQRARLAALLGGTVLVAAGFAAPAATAAATPAGLAFQTQPGGGPATVAWSQQPVVRVIDSGGMTVTTSTASVTLAIGTNPGAGTLTCSSGLTVAAVNGVANFSGCRIDDQGAGYTLIATAPGLSAATSTSFDIGPSTPISANHLDWALATANPPPLTGTAGGSLNFTFQVRVLDSNNAVVTSGQFATAAITLAMSPNPVGATVGCTGGLTVNAVAGVAQWSGCSVSAAGNGLSFVASATGVSPATSPAFNILAGGPAPTLTIAATRHTILWGEGIDLTIHLTAPAGSTAPVANRTIHVQVARVRAAGAFTTIAPGGDVVTDASGSATIVDYMPATNLWYQAVFEGAPDLGPVMSADTRVVVRQLAVVKPDNAGLVSAIARGTTIEFRTLVRPSRDDIPRSHVKWQLWRLVTNHWVLFLSPTSDPDVSGTAFLSVGFNTGSWRIRSRAAPTQLNANSVWTPFVQYTVK